LLPGFFFLFYVCVLSPYLFTWFMVMKEYFSAKRQLYLAEY
jgi:hypothetical protein